ncbi:lytic transglycosylase domain-containing protein [Fodinicola acaciae]|uniref:lytic transglycosylase domain-containing protein n=1 Tax=Fodinicola acaciae TaxID=2681555 RepID=UPI0013D81D0E|nr:lytic murein transglycosylase [Fodinicola acaciae]
MTPPLQLFSSRRKTPAPTQGDDTPTVDLVKRPDSDAPTKVEPAVVTRKRPKVTAPKSRKSVPVVPEESWVMPALPRKPRLSEVRDGKRRAHRALAFRALGYLGIALIIAGVSFLLVPQVRARNAALQVVPAPSQSTPAAPSAPDPFVSPTPAPSATASGAPVQPNVQAGPAMYAVWAQRLSPKLNIPVVALQAYAYAQVAQNAATPNCNISWTLLAGIGRAESDHGQEKGSVLNADGTSTPPILGIRLTSIRDTDNGQLDGDTQYDRAVGPMQFIPSTWKIYASDANGDGKADPFNINDAALASAKLLCANGRNLRNGTDWGAAVYAYNRVNTYVANVYKYADTYARQSLAS